MEKKIFLIYPYYFPHYRAGGPIQSLYNLAGFLKEDGQFYLVSLPKDIDGTPAEPSLQLNLWQTGPQGENVFYTKSFSFFLFWRLTKEIKPNVIFVNGLFNASTTLPGIILARVWGIKLVVSPRGMLQAWALQQKRTLTKRVYMVLVKIICGSKAIWHATDEQEKNDIERNFGRNRLIRIASNVPRQVALPTLLDFPSVDGKIRLVFLSLINPNKNLHLIIEQVKRLPRNLTLDIYGPIRNSAYWNKCEQAFHDCGEITYKGEVPPWDVQRVLQQYHFFVLPTAGENFGHAIFDALSCGVPVVISRNTPWQKIDESGAGFYVDIDNTPMLSQVFDDLLKLDTDKYQSLRQNSHRYAKSYYQSKNFREEYRFLFS